MSVNKLVQGFDQIIFDDFQPRASIFPKHYIFIYVYKI